MEKCWYCHHALVLHIGVLVLYGRNVVVSSAVLLIWRTLCSPTLDRDVQNFRVRENDQSPRMDWSMSFAASNIILYSWKKSRPWSSGTCKCTAPIYGHKTCVSVIGILTFTRPSLTCRGFPYFKQIVRLGTSGLNSSPLILEYARACCFQWRILRSSVHTIS